ncbi:MAG: YkgJ family cysteine cluster protein [Planctomycetaceae bacterium]|nr:YkgJ family cysteine cluster protein [Planctomycetaceae bacterium]
MKSVYKTKRLWYAGGLHFECVGCGNCCAGPAEGYIWLTLPEIEFLAGELRLTPDEVQTKFLRRIGPRHTIKEDPKTKDCTFLSPAHDGCRGCAIYSVRPNQCRTWPFWSSNLYDPSAWNVAAMRCPGVNRGRLYSLEEIHALKSQTRWW